MSLLWRFDQEDWEHRLQERAVLELAPGSTIAIKRDVRDFTVSVAARPYVDAFARAMADPERRFGGIQLMRPRHRIGRPFELGERFQGRYPLRAFLAEVLPLVGAGAQPSRAAPEQGSRVGWAAVLCNLENTFVSDYGQIVELQADLLPARIRYVYLEGSAMAGSSTFTVRELDAGTCLVTQIWEYQELRRQHVAAFATYVLRLHLGVVYSQVEQAAELAGGRILTSNVPDEYHPRDNGSGTPSAHTRPVG